MKKKKISRNCEGHDGYAPIVAYLGMEGWCRLEVELRPGSQHSQEGFILFMKRVIGKAITLTRKKLLVRLDSAHAVVDTLVLLRSCDKVSYIITCNPSREDLTDLYDRAFAEGQVTTPRKDKRVALFTICKRQEHNGKSYFFTKVIRVTESNINNHGQICLVPDISVDGWWTNLALSEQEIVDLYKNHALKEQFHSELKTDMDRERLPSGKLATNALVMSLGGFAYSILRFIGQLGLLGDISPVRHPSKRRRLKTVILELMYLVARLIRSGNWLRLRFGCHSPAYQSFSDVYGKLLKNRTIGAIDGGYRLKQTC